MEAVTTSTWDFQPDSKFRLSLGTNLDPDHRNSADWNCHQTSWVNLLHCGLRDLSTCLLSGLNRPVDCTHSRLGTKRERSTGTWVEFLELDRFHLHSSLPIHSVGCSLVDKLRLRPAARRKLTHGKGRVHQLSRRNNFAKCKISTGSSVESIWKAPLV